eukprot:g5577.t1
MSFDLVQLESLCERVYNSQDARIRQEAEAVLAPLRENKDHIVTCREILDNSRSPYARLFASTSFRKLVTEHEFPPQTRLEMRNYVLHYLSNNVSGMEPYVVDSLVRLVCRIVRLGWFEDPQQRSIIDSCKKLMSTASSFEQYLLSVQILNGLILEMNFTSKKSGAVYHTSRKTSMSFRDEALLNIFKISLESIQHIKTMQIESKYLLLEEGLKLAIACMTFDFIGSSNDASSDEPGAIQIPMQWRPVIENSAVLELCLELYGLDKLAVSRLAIEFMVCIASVRRSLFPHETDRRKFLEKLVCTTLTILKSNLNLQDIQNYNEFCKLIGRLKGNFNLQDLISVANYNEWIEAVSVFTIESLNQWRCASGSIVHLLTLWCRMVTSISYIKAESCLSFFNSKIPTIVSAYINSRLECVIGAKNGVIEDPLDDEGKMQEQLETLPALCRFKYNETFEILVRIMDPLMEQLARLGRQSSDPVQFAIVEGKMAWMVYISASIIKGKPPSSDEKDDAHDESLASKVFQIVTIIQEGNHQRRTGEISRQKLDLAIISLMESYRSTYIADHRLQSSRLFVEVSQRGGRNTAQNENVQVLARIVDKIAWNLQFYPTVPSLITPSLKLFWDITTAFMNTKALFKLETVKKMLSGCSSDFAFLKEPANFRNRTLFYAIISRLLFTEDTTLKFQSFVAPIHHVLEGLKQYPSPESLRNSVPTNTVIGVFRDLRGMLEAASSDVTYNYIFSWLHPQYFPVIVNCIEAWADMPEVTTPILKFMAELALNKSSRISFSILSPNGILLFRQVSQVIVAYGRRVLTFPKERNQYQIRYKGTWICFLMFMRALVGNYTNFGVFELYGDPALSNAMEMTFNLMTMIPIADIIAYRKLLRAYFPLMDILLAHHISSLVKLDFQPFRTLISSLEAGLKSQDSNACSQCASAIDHLATYYYNHWVAQTGFIPIPEAAKTLNRHIQSWPTLFPTLLKTLVDIALFEESSAMWSLSRPILALIVINDGWFNQIKEDLMTSQTEEQRKHLNNCFTKLMENVERNLESKNRDRFTHNLSTLKHDFKGKR